MSAVISRRTGNSRRGLWGSAGAVFLLSAAVIALELSLMRCLSVSSWHHFNYLVISTALLGFGASGTFLTFAGERLRRDFAAWCAGLTLAFAVSVSVCFRLAQSIPLDLQYVFYSARQAALMCSYHLLLCIPFFIAATVIGLSLQHLGEQRHLVYGANLMGSGAGAILIVACMGRLAAERLLHVVVALVLASALLWILELSRAAGRRGVRWWFAWGACVLALAGACLRPVQVRLDPYKMLTTLRRWEAQGDAVHLLTRHSARGRIDVYDSPRMHRTLFAGLSAPQGPPAQLALLADGHLAGTVFKIRHPSQAGILDHTPMSVPYRLFDAPRVLLLGEAGGVNVWMARRFGAAHITVVQRNPQIVELMTGRLAAASGHVFSGPDVTVVAEDPRLFLEREGRRYDIIQLVGAEEMAAGTSGVKSLHEDFLLTRQGMALCLRRLSRAGLVAATRGVQMPPRDSVKMLATMAAALEDLGTVDPSVHLVQFRNYLAATTMASPAALSAERCAQIEKVCEEVGLDLEWAPRRQGGYGEQLYRTAGPPGKSYSYFHHAALEILSPRREALFRTWLYNVRPATDDSPYFHGFFRWRSLGRFIQAYGRHWLRRLELGYAVLVVAIAEALVVGAACILLPLLWLGRGRRGARGRWAAGGYFLLLGLSFMMLEMALILKCTRFLGDPIYAAAGMLGAFLIFSGLGSAARKAFSPSARGAILAAAIGIAVMVVALAAGMDAVFARLAGWPTAARMALSVAAVAPLGFLMGWPFPSGLSLVERASPSLVPWAWGVNGFASVAGAPLAVVLAMSFGYSTVMLLAGVFYLTAALVAFRLSSGPA